MNGKERKRIEYTFACTTIAAEIQSVTHKNRELHRKCFCTQSKQHTRRSQTNVYNYKLSQAMCKFDVSTRRGTREGAEWCWPIRAPSLLLQNAHSRVVHISNISDRNKLSRFYTPVLISEPYSRFPCKAIAVKTYRICDFPIVVEKIPTRALTTSPVALLQSIQ